MRLLGTLSVALLLACSGESATGGGSESGSAGAPPAGCYPGEVEPCACESGLRSVRACLADGGRGSCQCEAWGPGPGEFKGGGEPAPGVRVVELPVVDVQADPVSDVLYVTVSHPAAEYADSFVAIAPDTGSVLWATALGETPGVIAVSGDGTTAYVGVQDTPAIARIDTASHAETNRYPIPSDGATRYAWDMDVIPGAPNRFLLMTSDYPDRSAYGDLLLMENGAPVGAPPPFLAVDLIVVKDGTTAYGLANATHPHNFAAINLSATGYTVGQQSQFQEYFANDVAFDGSWVYAGPGFAIDPAAQAIVGRYEHGYQGVSARLVANQAADRVWVVGVNDSYRLGVRAFDRDAFTDLGELALEGIAAEPRRIARSKSGSLGVVLGKLASDTDAEHRLMLVSPSVLPGG